MQFAKDENGNRICITEANENGSYFCPFCDAPMIQRRGQVNVPHFAHAKGRLCTDTWKYEDTSPWHLAWQENFPRECREVAVINEHGRHRADVLVGNTVVEFQHSPMSPEEFQERNDFYVASGYRVIWVFDALEQHGSGALYNEEGSDLYYWKHAPKTLKGFDVYGKVQAYFHLQDRREDIGDAVIRLTWCVDGNLSFFRSSPNACYTEDEIVLIATQGSARRKADAVLRNELCHDLYVVRRKDNDKNEAFGCPLNKCGYASDVPTDDGRRHCNGCPYALNEDFSLIRKCAGRFGAFLDQVETVLEVKKVEGQIYFVTYVDGDGMIQERAVDVPESPASTIPELWNGYNAGVLCVRNIRTGKLFKILSNPSATLAKYGRVYGCYYNEAWGRYSNKSDVIYYATRPEWVVAWFKTEEQRRQFPTLKSL